MPLLNGENATMSGVCLEKKTAAFPSYPFQDEVEQDLIQAFKETKKRISKQLLKLEKLVGGDTDLMIGIRYLRYYSEKIFEYQQDLLFMNQNLKHRWYKRDSWRTTSCIYRNRETLLWFIATTENISIATIQSMQNGISSKSRYFTSEH